MELDGKSELPHDNDFIKEVASIRKPTDAIRVIAEATIREAAHEKCRGEVKEIAAEATESESVKEAIAKVNEFRDAIQEKAIEVAAAATPGGQALTAAMVAKEVASTVGKEIAKTAVKEVASQAVDATESESLQRVKGKIVETTTAATEKGLDGTASRSGDAIDRIPTESPYPRIGQASASEVDIAKESTAEEEAEAEEREHEVVESEGESDIADGESDAVTDDTVENIEGDNRTNDTSEVESDAIEKTDNTNRNNDVTDGVYIEKLRMEPPVIIVFKCPDGVDPKEFLRQIKGQERGLNSQTIAENTQNREAYARRKSETGNGRDPESKEIQERTRQKALQSRIESNQKNGMTYSEAKAEAENWIKGQAALHNPDQIAGGDPVKVSRMGDASVNSSIGVQWRSRVAILDRAIADYCKSEGVEPGDLTRTKLNVKLEMEVSSNGNSSRTA